MAKSRYKKLGQSRLRGRYHDLNSQRRYRSKTTVTWDAYKKRTNMGKKQYKKG